MTLEQMGAKIDALEAELRSWDERFLAPMNKTIEDIEQAGVRIERMKHRLNTLEEELA